MTNNNATDDFSLICFNSDLASLSAAGWSSPMASMFLSSTTDGTEVPTGVSKAKGLDRSNSGRVVLPSYGSERSPERHCGEPTLRTGVV